MRRCRNRSTPTTSRVWGRTKFRRRGSTTMWTRRLGTKLCLECLLRARGPAPYVRTDSCVRRKRSPGHTGEHTVFGATHRASSAAGACCAAVLLLSCCEVRAVLIKAPGAAMRCCHLCAQSCNSSTRVHERTHMLSFSACRTHVFHGYTRKQPSTRTHACTRAHRVACGLSCLVIVLQITRIYLRHLIRQQQAEQVGRA